MRATVDPRLTAGRDRVGRWASPDSHGLTGRFVVVGPVGRHLLIIGADEAAWKREGVDGEPWEHVSVSVLGRVSTPTWAEMSFVKDLFWDEDEVVFQLHPAKVEHVNNHPGCLHLWRPTVSTIPLPPKVCV